MGATLGLTDSKQISSRIVNMGNLGPVLPSPSQSLGSCLATAIDSENREERSAQARLDPMNEVFKLLIVDTEVGHHYLS